MSDPATGSGEVPDSEPQPCQDYQVLDLDIPSAEAASRLNSLFAEYSKHTGKLSDRTICEISNLLRVLGLPSANPRLYIVLRSIGYLETLEYFTENGITDFWFPLHIRSLPATLGEPARSAFLKSQWVVLTKSIDLENGADGEHMYFGPDDVIPFESQGRLGEGTYGAVDRVKSTVTGAVHARKRIRRSDRRNIHRNMEMFQKEVLAMKRLQHRHVVRLIGSYTDPVYAAFIISPVADCNLEQFLSAAAAEPTTQTLSVLRALFGCLATGLEYMHQQSVRHKDIKPMNILIKGKSVLYTDFGLAFDWADAGRSTTQESLPAMTRIYSAPELLTDAPRNSAADIWSLGCVFAEILSVLVGSTVSKLKEFLHEYGSGSAIYALNTDGLETFLSRIIARPDLPSEEEAFKWIKTMLRKAPQHRPTAKSLQGRIGNVLNYTGDCCKVSRSSVDFKDESLPMKAIKVQRPEDLRNFQELGETSGTRPTPLEDSTIETLRPGILGMVRTGHERSASGGLVIRTPHYSLPWGRSSTQSAPDVEQTKDFETTVSTMVRTSSRERAKPSPSSLKALFFAAVHRGDIPKAQAALDQGADVNTVDYSGVTAAIKVARNKDTKVLSFLLRNGADPDLQSSEGYTALHVAADVSSSDAIDLLIDAGATLDLRDFGKQSGATALFYAVRSRNVQCVSKLVTAGADANLAASNGTTPLSCSAENGDAGIVEILLAGGADPNSRTAEMWTPLHFCARAGHSTVTEMLIRHGADIEAENNGLIRPLHKAALLGHLECVNILLSKGAAVDAKDGDTHAALHKAAASGHTSIVRTLIDHRAPVDTQDKMKGTPLIYAARLAI